MELAPGARFGSYEIQSMLGAGGMGEVYRARDTRLDRAVALKFLPSHLISNVERRARFAREARLLATLNHPNIGSIYGLEEVDGRTALVLELVDGQTLADRLQRGPVKISEALTVARQIAEALEAAHDKGIVHRDLKPANVVLQRAGAAGRSGSDIRAKVLDFGLAKPAVLFESDASTVSPPATFESTSEGQIVGTPAYMSPEQARGEAVDKRTDIWAFGCVLFEMLTRRRPFAGNTATDTVARILEHEPDWSSLPDGTPEAIRKLLVRCLEKDLPRRLHDIGDARLELEDARGREPAVVRGNPRPATGGRRRLLAFAAAVLALSAASGLWWWSSKSRGDTSSTARTTAGGAGIRNLTRVTFHPGLQVDATWSPDGQSIAFASDHGGNFDIWVQRLDGGDASALTRSPAPDTEPAWSPDGRSIVFRSEREGGGLFLVPASGGPERQVASFGVRPQWTSDGTEILFRGSPVSIWSSELSFDQTSGLYTVPARGGEPPRQILESFLSGGVWPWISSHPDGRISALGRHAKRGWGFFTISRDGSHVTPSEIAADLPLRLGDWQLSGTGNRLVRFQWSAAGTALFLEAIVNEVQSIWRVEIEPETLRWRSVERLTTGGGTDVRVALSRDDRRLLFTSEKRASRVWAFPFDASAGRLVAQGTPVTPEEEIVTWSTLSPDGSRIAYATSRAGTRQSDLWTVNVNGSRRELLAQGADGGVWARDSRAFAYPMLRANPAEWAVGVRVLEGTERLLSPWTRESAFLPTDWLPDGSALLGSYMSPLSTPAVLAFWPTASPASKPLRVALAVADTSLWQARMSPDGRWIACVLQRHGGSQGVELAIFRAADGPSGKLTRIAPDHVWPDKPKWAPNGKALYFLSRQHTNDLFDLWGVRFDPDRGVPGTPFRVTHFDSPSQMISRDIGNSDIGIAERVAVLTIEKVTGNIWLLDNVDK
jgi:serine/threonine protein kinase/Tol biopolymer transport system component